MPELVSRGNALRSVALVPTLILLLALMSAPELVAQDGGQGAAFRFRGRLVVDQQPVDTGGRPGPYHFRFVVYDGPDPETGKPLAEPLEQQGLPLRDGIFETELAFGVTWQPGQRVWVEATVTRLDDRSRVVAQSRSSVIPVPPTAQTAANGAPMPRTITRDADVLSRLGSVKLVISDRNDPGNPHFLVDEASFRRAFGLGPSVTTLDVAGVGVVAAAELTRQLGRTQAEVQELHIELDRLRFRSNLTLLLLAVLVVTVLLQRRSERSEQMSVDGHDKTEPEQSSPEEE